MSNNRGLTFIELMIAVMMVAILFVGLSTHLRAGMTVWQRVTQSTDMHQRERASLERLERDLANAFVFDDRDSVYAPSETSLSPVAFEGAKITFYSAPTRSAIVETPVNYITYQCNSLGGQSGLWRQQWTINESRAKAGPDPELILPECKSVQFTYAYLRSDEASQQAQPLDWHAFWEEAPKALPRLIHVEMSLAERQKNRGVESVEQRKVERVILIPVGVLRAPKAP